MFFQVAIPWMWLVGAILMGGALSSAQTEPPLFTALSFDDALKKAQQDKKLVFIDFYTTWCGPCKVLEQTTFKDQKVIAWLKQHAVAIRLDAEKEVDLAGRYRVEGYPTLLFLRADATEMGRIVGALKTEEFLSEAEAIRSGKDPLTRAREKLAAAGENNPMARQDFAGRLAEMGRYEEALKEYLWCFDEGVRHDPSYVGVHGSFLLGEIASLGRRLPRALEELRKRRDAADERLAQAGSSFGALSDLMDFAAINRELGESARTLALYDRLSKEQPSSPHLAMIKRLVFDELLEARRYDELARGAAVLATVEQEIARHQSSLAFLPEAQRKDIEPRLREFLIGQLARYYEVLIGTRNETDAAKIAERILEIDGSAATWHALAQAGLRTASPLEVNVQQAQKAHELSKGESAEIADTLAQLLAARGRTAEACTVLETTLKKLAATDESGRTILMERKQQLGCGAATPP